MQDAQETGRRGSWAARAAVALAMGVAGTLLLGYGFLSYQVGARHVNFVRSSTATDLFPQKWLWEGYARLYEALDPQGAEQAFQKALERHPTFMDAWWALFRTRVEQGKMDDARAMLQLLSKNLAQVSTWKWQECLGAFDLRDDAVLASCVAFILERMPARSRDAVFLAEQYWGHWEAVADHVKPTQHEALLRQWVAAKDLTAAYGLWQRMRRAQVSAEPKTTLQLCDALLGERKLMEAKEVWRHYAGAENSGVYDGGFEQEPLRMAFGWRITKTRDAAVERSVIEPFEGRYSLHVRFLGTANTAFSHVAQVVPLRPDTPYRLRFARKARGLTTDQGVFVEVTGYGCQGLSVRSEPLLGTAPWSVETLAFHAPSECEAAWIRLRRKESLKFDNKIFGDYWLDSVTIETP